jgi:hypothetical protein
MKAAGIGLLAGALLCSTSALAGSSIYKCQGDGVVLYTDRGCPKMLRQERINLAKVNFTVVKPRLSYAAYLDIANELANSRFRSNVADLIREYADNPRAFTPGVDADRAFPNLPVLRVIETASGPLNPTQE